MLIFVEAKDGFITFLNVSATEMTIFILYPRHSFLNGGLLKNIRRVQVIKKAFLKSAPSFQKMINNIGKREKDVFN
jgi:hypothetical protein